MTDSSEDAASLPGQDEPGAGRSSTRPGGRWISWLIGASAANPVLTILCCAMLAGAGWFAVLRTPLDAIPDLAPPQVIVLGTWEGRSPELVEDQITQPVSSALLATPDAAYVRGQSYMGLSFVYVIFEDGVDPSVARGQVHEALDEARNRLPNGASLSLGPDASGVGWVYQYALLDSSGNSDIAELTALQDWELRDALESVAGVAEVATVGGVVKEYQVELNPLRLLEYSLTVDDVEAAIRDSNVDAGGGVMERGGQEHLLRGRGYLRGAEDLRKIPVAAGRDGVTVRLGELATVSTGPQPRRGVADLDGQGEVVGGIVVMRPGLNALTVIEDVKARIRQLEPGLPEGVELVPVYDRTELITSSIQTLRRTLLEEMLMVSLVVGIFLLRVRSVLVVLAMLPVAVLAAFIPMVSAGVTANIMSLGGIAVAVGAMVDGAIIIVENVHRRLEELQGDVGDSARARVILDAMREVGPSIFISLLVITVSFIPVFGLEATEGRLFRPLALTKTWVMFVGAGLSITLTPALVVLVLRGASETSPGARSPMRWLSTIYAGVVRRCVRRRRLVVVVAILAMIGTVPAFLKLDREFMPPLNEGSLLFMPSAPPGMSINEASSVLQAMDRQIVAVPEVERVFGKIGRARTATDPAPLAMAEVTIQLKHRRQWRPGVTWESLVDELDAKVQIPGMPNLWWMPIQTRTEMLATGIRSPLAIQLSGDDPEDLERAGRQLEPLLRKISGTRSVVSERATGGEFLDVVLDRERAALHGVRARDLERVVSGVIGGARVGETVEGRRRFPISVRYQRELRDDFDELERALVSTMSGTQVQLSDVATIERRRGPSMLRSEDGKLVSFVFIDPGTRPVEGWVRDAQATMAASWAPPSGVFVSWRGAFEDLERAEHRLRLLIPLTLLIVAMLLYWNTGSVVGTALVMTAVPFSLIGAVWFVYLLDFNLSIAVWVGMIALAGLDAETGVVMLLYLDLAVARRRQEGAALSDLALEEAIVEGAAGRLRPKLMTVTCLICGLAPMMWSDASGADVMQRIAAPMVGGLVTSFVLELTVIPSLYAMWQGRRLKSSGHSAP